MRQGLLAPAVLVAALTIPVAAHHSMAVAFDMSRRVPHQGTLTRLDWKNPHIHLFVEIAGDEEVTTWSFEGPSPAFFRARDVGRAEFESSIGKVIALEASPARDGSTSGLLRRLSLADGMEVLACPQNC